MSENDPYDALSKQEFKILALLADGLSDREIAERLIVAYSTVKWYNRQIFNKLGVDNRRAAVAWFRARRLVGQGDTKIVFHHNLPAQVTPFIGRTKEVTDIMEMMRDQDIRLITILAPGGMGKTRLALAVAEQVVNHAESMRATNGVYFVPLAGLSAPEQIVPLIADCTGLQFSPDSRTPRQQLLDFLSRKAFLLVLDNFEHLLDGATLVSDLLQAAQRGRVLVTSRERLNLHVETVYGLGGIADDGAVQLFLQNARQTRPDFASDQAADVQRICQLVQGMPLAIELAAVWVGVLSPAEIADEIGRSLDFLHTTMRDVPERLRSVRVVFESSWQRLSANEQDAFCRLAVFRGGCTREAGQIVTGAGLQTLTDLANRALLWRNATSERFEIHELLRQYAYEKLEGETDAAQDAHSDYYLTMLAQRKADLEGAGQLAAMREVGRDIENVRAAWVWAAQHGKYEALARSLPSLWLYYHLTGKYVEGEFLLEQAALLLSGADQDGLLGALLARRAYFSIQYYEYARAKNLLDESEGLLQHSGDVSSRAFLALTQGWLVATQDQSAEAHSFFDRARLLYGEAGELWGVGFALLGMGRSYGKRLANDKSLAGTARKWLLEALAVEEQVGDLIHLARTVRNLGLIALAEGEYAEAERLMLASLEYHHQLGNNVRIEGDLHNLGYILARQGKYDEARRYLEESIALCQETGNLNAERDTQRLLEALIDPRFRSVYPQETGRLMPERTPG